MRKYIRLREDVQSFVDEFYNSNMRGATFLAAHVRSSDKAAEVRHLHELNSRYRVEIEKILKANPGMRLFLMTDGLEILEEYKKGMAIYWSTPTAGGCIRTARESIT